MGNQELVWISERLSLHLSRSDPARGPAADETARCAPVAHHRNRVNGRRTPRETRHPGSRRTGHEHEFRVSANGVWLTAAAPPEFLRRLAGARSPEQAFADVKEGGPKAFIVDFGQIGGATGHGDTG